MISYSPIQGLIAAPLTGYNPDGSVNLDIIPDYAALLRENGVAGVFVNGTTGEGLLLTVEERCAQVEHWLQAATDDFRVIVHVGHCCQAEARCMAKHAAEAGAAGIGEMGPVFFRPSTLDDLVTYVANTAAAAPELPYYYYHIPSMNQVEFPMVDLLAAVDGLIPNFAGIKYTHDDFTDYDRCRVYADGKFDILFGRDEYLISGLKGSGVSGAVGSTYNIAAPLYLKLMDAYAAGDVPEAERLQAISAALCIILSETGGFGAAMKQVMKRIGLDFGPMRSPGHNITDAEFSNAWLRLKKIGAVPFVHTM